MEIELAKRDLLILCLVFSISFFLLGLWIDDFNLPEAMRVSSNRLVPIYKVDTPEKKVAITLDGMWGAKKTPEILKTLRDHDVNITFFFGGNWLEENPQLVKEIAANGHEVGNHSYTHPHMAQLGTEEIIQELNRTAELIKELTGQKPDLFRPPFGEYNNRLIKTSRQQDYHIVQWSIDSLDWKDVSTEFIVKTVMKNLSPGEIVLMHNNGQNTTEALKKLLPKIKQEGYEIVPLSELIYKDNYYIESHSGLQKQHKGVE
ncbi:polysaccharide deacetylase family protein [Halanaerobacter jeridensis]|uniref:Polysaccharide deacetylase family sporulation protein PdaB n=1 Tax=Halanaerobacter jeridensis TaxID=706427 RepID=A0A938XQY5_9FIRM|nr:polysaccharide deacetylase family protein [Halanaerobacter jeridensis]MBM7557922.1 polysaccharide deacetylase family sporulation protein PdaB [Halanaerobacter jeridensis]